MDIRPPWYVLAILLVAGSFVSAPALADPPHAVGSHVQAAIGHKVSAFVHHAAAAVGHVVGVKHKTVPLADDDGTTDVKPHASDGSDRTKNAGVVEGQVVSVDYQSGMIGLMTADRGRVDVMVMPSTNIQGRGDDFHTIADIARGSRLRVFMSQRAGQFFAQIIRLR